MTDLEFRKSSYSGNRQNCVEVARHPDVGTAVRDTQHRDAGHLALPLAEWAAFLVAVKSTDM